MKYDAKDTPFGDFTAYLVGKGEHHVSAKTFG